MGDLHTLNSVYRAAPTDLPSDPDSAKVQCRCSAPARDGGKFATTRPNILYYATIGDPSIDFSVLNSSYEFCPLAQLASRTTEGGGCERLIRLFISSRCVRSSKILNCEPRATSPMSIAEARCSEKSGIVESADLRHEALSLGTFIMLGRSVAKGQGHAGRQRLASLVRLGLGTVSPVRLRSRAR